MPGTTPTIDQGENAERDDQSYLEADEDECWNAAQVSKAMPAEI